MVTVTAYRCLDTRRRGVTPGGTAGEILRAMGTAPTGEKLASKTFEDPPKVDPPSALEDRANDAHDPKAAESYERRRGGKLRSWSEEVNAWSRSISGGDPVRWAIEGETE